MSYFVETKQETNSISYDFQLRFTI